ncbi:precorrin-6A synthase (deacetylating) [Thiorhodococcus mannitoliphagus]|uniref:Precorrin-6A synthase (Deacetylating) n=1 Tax=Thiorhodococcus mannitoliphagus TaxID=329406 RepID=A0A6P1DVB1_9GAMM|nr:precorrin-6A synthase (deacetylating) [Thiorhodococcus mannitoliphagus]NEX19992.1 precorrin-6A synthase (deacetylating) [Thiorhodococcus mannitoliphagus]
MKKLYLIGMGPGGPQYLTIQAIETLKRTNVFFMLEKEGQGKEELLQMRKDILTHYLGESGYRVVIATSPPRRMTAEGYKAGVKVWHDEKRALFERLLTQELDDGQSGALLLWGDPSIYDQTVSLIAELAASSAGELDFEIIPGITSVQMLTARHKIPMNRVGESITITTGRHAETCDPADLQNAVVMLDYNASFQRFKGQNMDVYWGGYLGCPDEVLVSGPIDEVTDDLLATKAAVRDKKGWLMDIYLLRRRETDDSKAS